MYIGMLFLSCASTESETEEKIVEQSGCSPGVYSVYLKVWTQGEEENNIDTETLCETDFAVEFFEDGRVESAGICEFERGNNTRRLTYDIRGQHQDADDYEGDVIFTRGNGDIEETTFTGYCSQQDTEIDILFEWYLSFTAGNGTRNHHATISVEE